MKNKTYSEKDLVSFGEYLLSKKREKSIEDNSQIDAKRKVYHADLENWKNEKRK